MNTKILVSAFFLFLFAQTSVAQNLSEAKRLAKSGQHDESEKMYAAPLDSDPDNLRSLDFVNPDAGRDGSLASALKLYRDEEWEKARVELVQYCKMYSGDKIGKYYLGLALFQQGEYAKAASHFTHLTVDAPFELRNPAKWYLALCYTQFRSAQGFKDARVLMQQLAADPDSGYAKEAKAFIRQILE